MLSIVRQQILITFAVLPLDIQDLAPFVRSLPQFMIIQLD